MPVRTYINYSGTMARQYLNFSSYQVCTGLVKGDICKTYLIAGARINYRDVNYANTPMQYTAVFHGCKNVNF